MEQYIKSNGDKEWCIHPLPLLTALGNGLGGGDYSGEVGKGDAGSWTFDEVYVTHLKPSIMEAVEFRFQE